MNHTENEIIFPKHDVFESSTYDYKADISIILMLFFYIFSPIFYTHILHYLALNISELYILLNYIYLKHLGK